MKNTSQASSSKAGAHKAKPRALRGHELLVLLCEGRQRGSALPIPPGASGWKLLIRDKCIIVQEALQRASPAGHQGHWKLISLASLSSPDTACSRLPPH